MKWSWRKAFGLEQKDILAWRGDSLSTENGNNFTTNQVTVANVRDIIARGNGSAIGLSATWACVNLIAGTIASLPLMVYRDRDGVREVAKDHPLYFVLHDSPNFDQTSLDFWEYECAGLELHGNAYATIERRNDGTVYSLTPIKPDLVKVERGANGFLEYSWIENGIRRFRDAKSMLHIRGPLGDALGGASTLSVCRSAFDSALASGAAAETMFSNGIRPSGILSTDPSVSLTADQRREFEELLTQKFQGAMNAGRPMLLDRGMKWTQIDLSPEDAQMLDSRKFDGEEICRIFGVPPAMVGFGDKASNWGTGKEVDVLGFQKFTLRRRMKRIEQALMKQLLTPADKIAGVTIEFNLDGLLRGDTESRYDAHEKAIRMGLATRNERRKLENLPPIDGGDVVTVQMQNVPLSDAVGPKRIEGGNNGQS